MNKKKKLTASILINTLRMEGFAVVFKRWTGKNYVNVGRCDPGTLGIELNYNRFKRLPRTQQRILFIHELIHLYFDSHFSRPLFGEIHIDDEEVMVEALAADIVQRSSPSQLKRLDEFMDGQLAAADAEFDKRKREKL